jgi:hypothetical protein
MDFFQIFFYKQNPIYRGVENEIIGPSFLKYTFTTHFYSIASPPLHLLAAMFAQKKTARPSSGQKKHDLGMVRNETCFVYV